MRWLWFAQIALLALAGCAGWHDHLVFFGDPPAVAPVENPIFVPVADCQFVTNQVVDTLDNYFKTSLVDPVRVVDGALTEGRIETYPTTGSTLLEPWRSDSSPGYERLHATLQTIRRRAIVQIVPSQGGVSIQVQVLKELEDVDRPDHATAGQNIQRTDGNPGRVNPKDASGPVTLGWIPLGRDSTLEQRILQELRGRLTDVMLPKRIPVGPASPAPAGPTPAGLPTPP